MFWPVIDGTSGPKRGWQPITSAREAASIARTGFSFSDVRSIRRASSGRSGPTSRMTSIVDAMGTATMTIRQAAANSGRDIPSDFPDTWTVWPCPAKKSANHFPIPPVPPMMPIAKSFTGKFTSPLLLLTFPC
jgi:hypothetical protein